MTLFGKYKFLIKFSGLDPQGGRKNIIAQIIFLFTFILLILSTFALFAVNFRTDIDRAFLAVPICLGNSAILAAYSHLLLAQKKFYSYLDVLQVLVHESEWKIKICIIVS